MKKLFFALGLLLVISLSTSTAFAQRNCYTPTSTYITLPDGSYVCVGSGGLGDYPYGDVSAFATEAHCTTYPPCGYCYGGYAPDGVGICNYPPCVGDQNTYWGLIYLATMDPWIATETVGCYYVAYGDLFKQSVPKLKPEKEKPVEARWWTFVPVQG